MNIILSSSYQSTKSLPLSTLEENCINLNAFQIFTWNKKVRFLMKNIFNRKWM